MIVHRQFYFLRHGQTDWNKEGRCMGQLDVPLNEAGEQQAFQAAQLLKDVEFEHIVSSPLSRAYKTAQIISDQTGKKVHVIDGLKEGHWGVTQGKLKGSAGTTTLDEWKSGIPVEGGEDYTDFRNRIIDTFNTILANSGPILIVSHGGVHWALQDILKVQQSDLANCVPLLHIPPQDQVERWVIKNFLSQELK